MKKLILTLVVAITCFFLSKMVSAAPASQKSIEQMMQMTGSKDLGKQMLNQMLPALQNMVPDAPAEFWSEMMKEIDSGEIQSLITPIYQKYLTEADVQAINSFYETEAGQKLLKVQPAIMQESFIVGQQWGQGIARKIVEKYQAQQ